MEFAKNHEGAYATAFSESRKRLQSLSPSDICERALCEFDEQRGCFILESFGHKIQISYSDGRVTFFDTDTSLPIDWGLILLNYLSSAKPLPLANHLASYRELPLGNVFYPNLEVHVFRKLGDFYSQCDKGILQKIFAMLNFEATEHRADLAVVGKFAPRVPVKVLFWEGEDEIPGSCQILFDRTISEQMHIEDIAALCGVLKNLILDPGDINQIAAY